jgi:hypothetical protein
MIETNIWRGGDHLRVERDYAAFSTGPYLEYLPSAVRYFLNGELIEEAEYQRLRDIWASDLS